MKSDVPAVLRALGLVEGKKKRAKKIDDSKLLTRD